MSKNIEIGLQRLFLVCWAALAMWAVGYSIYFVSIGHIFDALALTAMGVVLPGILMLAIRWIYRGFKPNDGAA